MFHTERTLGVKSPPLTVCPPVDVAAGVATAVVAVFAVFHGHAHGVELPSAASPLAYGIGFVIATGSLHLCGIALGSLCEQRGRAWLVPAAGYAIALVGVFLLLRAVGVTA